MTKVRVGPLHLGLTQSHLNSAGWVQEALCTAGDHLTNLLETSNAVGCHSFRIRPL